MLFFLKMRICTIHLDRRWATTKVANSTLVRFLQRYQHLHDEEYLTMITTCIDLISFSTGLLRRILPCHHQVDEWLAQATWTLQQRRGVFHHHHLLLLQQQHLPRGLSLIVSATHKINKNKWCIFLM